MSVASSLACDPLSSLGQILYENHPGKQLNPAGVLCGDVRWEVLVLRCLDNFLVYWSRSWLDQ